MARTESSHTVAENVILPAAVDMCEVVWDSQCVAKLKQILLSNNTISRRIDDIKIQLLERLNKTYFAIQLDESTNISRESQQLVYVRYCWSGEMIDFLFSHQIPGRATGSDVFDVLCDFCSQSKLP